MDSVSAGPYLSLRGGGASATRKEARKRKFDHLAEPQSSAGQRRQLSPQDSADEIETTISYANVSQTGLDREANSSDPSLVSTADEAKSGEADETGQGTALREESKPDKPKTQRFVVFIGNLPYTATDESIRRHFASLKPTSIRHRYEKGSGKSKGFAFLEFRNYDHMRTCLKKFHQSAFDDGVSPARNLNVELTAGGGGSKSKDRRAKLKAKNEKLRQERERRTLNEVNTKKEGTEPQKDRQKPGEHWDVHPSRRTQVKSVK